MKPWAQIILVIFLIVLNCTNAFLPYQLEQREPIKILGLFSPDEEELATAFEIAIRRVNKDTKLLPQEISLEPMVRYVENYDSLTTVKIVCNATSEGIAAIFGPQSIENRNIIESMSQIFDIPHIEAFWDPNKYSIPMNAVHGVNVYPESDLISQGISEIIKDMDWETFTIVYEKHENLVYLQEVLQNAYEDESEIKPGHPPIIVRQLPPDTMDFRPLLKEIKNASESHILLDCAVDKIVTILKQAQEVNLMGNYQNYILTNLNAHTIDFGDFNPGEANITAVRMINPNSPTIRSIMNGWIYEGNEQGKALTVKAETVKIESALMYDAVYLYATALTALGESKPLPSKLSCENPSSWQHGLGIGNLVKSISAEGMTGKIKLDSLSGRRNSFSLEFVEWMSSKWKVLGTWSTSFGLNHSRTVEQMDKEYKEKIENRTFVVITKLVEPYLTLDKKTDTLLGYSRDLIDMIAQEYNFTYVLKLEPDNKLGNLNSVTGKWDGLIGSLQEQKADLAICDLTITSERRNAVDFTMPFMTLGISILYRKPQKESPDLFSFLEPLSFDVWVYMATAYLSVSLLLFFLARMTPYEWNSHHPCNRDTDYLENSLTMTNIIWHNCGSLMQQGSDVAPQ
uniref:Glutamate receptor ionotropic, kainate 2 n=1 Tax=Cacopsylla melanoneura TaxID=428564 RepID=A0A8D9EDR1_9HEMI